ncbi:alkane 1-monooxygenase [uncultured Aliiroseovarius sp.]|uniref:alkane 1-monooxygenase n=1 Tax=uncultured Aliiroseovarius sp. TaxID=1658783 RepID=UPI00262A6BD2|nr:alkane 1-monooxygenase [uncultured Aliiroseovarius sp.]
MSHPLRFFAFAAGIPALLIAAASFFGGLICVILVLYMTAIAFGLDQAISRVAPALDEGSIARDADRLSIAIAASHFVALVLVVVAFSGHTSLSGWELFGLFWGAGLYFGQISNANAHELIHRADKRLKWLGVWVYISLLFGHHASAHPKVHHRFVATPDDPNTAQEGESFFAFAPRAWKGSFVAGYEMETHDLERAGRSALRNPYVVYVSGAALMVILAAVIGGLGGLVGYLLVCAYAQTQLLLSDYVQHYGLMRDTREDGRVEPVGPQHSWNAPHWFTTHMMLNAPRHSDHHAHPMRPYPALRLPSSHEAPMLPYSLPVMATIALSPRLWRRVMGRTLRRWRDQATQAQIG